MLTRTLAIFFACAVAASAGAQQPVFGAGAEDLPPIRVISDGEMGRYVAALEEIVPLGMEAMLNLGADPTQLKAMAAGAITNQQMLSVIERKGFDPQSFTSVHWNAMMAYAALELEPRRAELEKARREQAAAMEAMKAQLSPAQFEQMKKSMAGATAMLDRFRDVPPANVALAMKYRAQLDSILER
jgi:hypothetical protein